MHKKSKFISAAACIVAVFLVTNPSLQAFKDYLGVAYSQGISKKTNLFVLSFFQRHEDQYIGLLGQLL
jgi:hypothetical protein